jgi:outer membrane protein assembly factor BamE (lipoprotein component of BamABCDE complex)
MNQKWISLAALVFACFSGCVVVPATPRGEGIIAPQTIKAIKIGETREDLLLSLGDPAKRLSDDRYFVYDWVQSVGYLVFFAPSWERHFGSDIKSRHYLAIEFDSDNRVRRLANFSHWASEGSDVELKKWIDEGGN